jgi:putative oxidoreductase
MKKTILLLYWAARILAALIMLQTLFFKFSGSEESVYIFTAVGMEPIGRIAVGVLELVAAILILVNTTVWAGALLGAGLMAGALMMHLTILGIEVKGDGGYLFVLALIVLTCCSFVLWINRERLLMLAKKLARN